MATSPADIAIFCFGNAARGDDALGEHMHAFLQSQLPDNPGIRLICDFQLEPEHIFDLQGARAGIFIDAHEDAASDVQWTEVKAGTTLTISSHHLPAESLLYLYEETFGEPAPPCYLLTLAGENFELDEGLSATAQRNLRTAQDLILEKLAQLERMGN